MEKPDVFIDINVLISGLYPGKGNPGLILDSYISGKINILISQKVLNEVIKVLVEKLPEITILLQEFLTGYPPRIIKDPDPAKIKKWSGIINDEDAIILESAISSKCDYLVTGDRHFYENAMIEKRSGLKVVKPGDFVEIFKREGFISLDEQV